MYTALLLATALASQTVTRVVDGDTVDLSTGERIRLAGVDAPELDQPGGAEAQAALVGLALDRPVTLHDAKPAAYGRTQARLQWRQWDLGVTLLAQGHAWADPRFRPPQKYLETQAKAKAARKGLWRREAPVPPWDWRKRSELLP